jgi:hypothetical protein
MPSSGRVIESPHRDRPIMAKFYEGLEALNAPNLRIRRAQHAEYCRARLQKLEARALANPEPDTLAECAIIRLYLAGECLFPETLEAEAIELGEIALREAIASGYSPVIFDCLGSLGFWYSLTGNDDRAVNCFHRAIAYADEPGVTTQRKCSEVMTWLGKVWSRNEDTLPLARMTAQWRRSLEPYEIDAWRDEFIWLIRHRRQPDVEAVVAAAGTATCAQAAELTAALLALGRYEAAMEAARAGRSRALAEGEGEWSRTFDNLLSPEGPAIQGR